MLASDIGIFKNMGFRVLGFSRSFLVHVTLFLGRFEMCWVVLVFFETGIPAPFLKTSGALGWCRGLLVSGAP